MSESHEPEVHGTMPSPVPRPEGPLQGTSVAATPEKSTPRLEGAHLGVSVAGSLLKDGQEHIRCVHECMLKLSTFRNGLSKPIPNLLCLCPTLILVRSVIYYFLQGRPYFRQKLLRGLFLSQNLYSAARLIQ